MHDDPADELLSVLSRAQCAFAIGAGLHVPDPPDPDPLAESRALAQEIQQSTTTERSTTMTERIDQLAAPIWRAAGLEPPVYQDVGAVQRGEDTGDESLEEIWVALHPDGPPFPGETAPPTDAAVDSFRVGAGLPPIDYTQKPETEGPATWFARGAGLDEKGRAR